VLIERLDPLDRVLESHAVVQDTAIGETLSPA
jgi:hypothetical protein